MCHFPENSLVYPTKDSDDFFGFVAFPSSCRLGSYKRDAVSCSDLCVSTTVMEGSLGRSRAKVIFICMKVKV